MNQPPLDGSWSARPSSEDMRQPGRAPGGPVPGAPPGSLWNPAGSQDLSASGAAYPHASSEGGGLRVGSQLGPYQIRGLLGRGGMGAVYDAVHTGLQRPVALKTLLEAADGPEEVQRFLIEAQALGRLDHPHVVRLYDAGEIRGLRYLALEKVEGQSLAELLREGPLPPPEAARILTGLCEGVAAAHALGILHRDLKPENVLLDQAGTPRLTDFGLAKIDRRRLTQTGEVMGTPNFMAPEQVRGERARQGPVTDVYGLGGVLYACLTGESPYADQPTALAVLSAAAEGPPRPIRQAAPRTPPDLEAIAARAMARMTEERYPNASELRLDLERFLRGEPVEARPLGTAARVARRVKRELPLLTGAVLVTSLICGGLFLAARPYLMDRSAAELAQAEAWREAELTRLRAELPSEPSALEALVAEAEPSAIRARAAAALAPGGQLSDAQRRGLEGPAGLEAQTAPLRARVFGALGSQPGAAGAAALASAVVLAPEAPAGREASLSLGARLRRRAGEPALGPAAQGAARRAARALLSPLAGESAAARRELAWLEAGQLRFAEALALCGQGESSSGDDVGLLRDFVATLAKAEPNTLEGGEVLCGVLACGCVVAGPGGARLVPDEGPGRRFARPPGASALLSCAWGPLRVAGRDELHLLWRAGAEYVWQTHDLQAQHDEPHLAWKGKPPADTRSVAFGDFDGDRCLDLALMSYGSGATSSVVFAPQRKKAQLRLLWSRPAPQATRARPFPPGPVPANRIPPYAFHKVLALDLVPETEGPARDELVITPTELASPPAVLVMGFRGGQFVCLTDLLHGPVREAAVAELEGREVALLTVDRQPGAASVPAGVPQEEGHTILGSGPGGLPAFVARWPYPGPVGDASRQTHQGAMAWLTELGGRPHLIRAQLGRPGYRLQATSIAALQAAGEESAPPAWELHLPVAPATAPRVFRGELEWGGVRYRPGPPARHAPQSERAATRTPVEALTWAGRVLELLGHEPEAERFGAAARARFPHASATRDREWERLQRRLARAREAEQASREAFSALLGEVGRERWARARSAYLAAAAAAAESAREGQPWSPPPGAAWELASQAYFAAGRPREGLAAVAAGLEVPGLSPALQGRLEAARRRWAGVSEWRELALPLDLGSTLALGPRGAERVTWSAKDHLGSVSPREEAARQGEPALRVRVAAERQDGVLIPCSLGAGPWRLEAELDVEGGAWCGELELGIFRGEDEGIPRRCSGLRFGFWDVFTRRLNVAPVVDGRVCGRERIGWPSYFTRLGLTLEVSTTPSGETRFLWELRDGAGQLAFRRVEVLSGGWKRWGATERVYLGLVSAPSRNTKDSSAENTVFGQESFVRLGRFRLRAPGARALELAEEPRELLWAGHAALARDDADAASRAYARGLAKVEERPRALERVSYELSPSARDLAWELRWWRGIARSGSGDADGWRELEACLRARPDRGLRGLEALAVGAPRAFERQTTEPLLDALVKDQDPLLAAIGRALRDGDLRDLDPEWGRGVASRERAFLRLQCAQAAAAHQDTVHSTIRSVLRAWEPGVHLPRFRFPLLLRPGRLPAGANLDELSKPSPEGRGSPGRDLARAQVVIAARPQEPGGYYLQMVSLFRLRAYGPAADAAREVLRRRPPAPQRVLALHLLAQQAARLQDQSALRGWKRLLRESGVSEDEIQRRYGK